MNELSQRLNLHEWIILCGVIACFSRLMLTLTLMLMLMLTPHASHSGSYSGSRSLAATATAGGASAGLVLEGDLGTLVMQPGLARLVSHRLRWPCFKLATLRIPDRTIPKPHNVGVDPRPCRVDLSWNL